MISIGDAVLHGGNLGIKLKQQKLEKTLIFRNKFNPKLVPILRNGESIFSNSKQ